MQQLTGSIDQSPLLTYLFRKAGFHEGMIAQYSDQTDNPPNLKIFTQTYASLHYSARAYAWLMRFGLGSKGTLRLFDQARRASKVLIDGCIERGGALPGGEDGEVVSVMTQMEHVGASLQHEEQKKT